MIQRFATIIALALCVTSLSNDAFAGNIDLGIEIYMKYVSKNLGDPGLFLGTVALEEELATEIGELFGGKDIIGTFTTGGSEANLIALRIAKKLRPDIKKPEIVLPVSAHVSFDKAADLLGVKLRKARLKKDFKLDNFLATVLVSNPYFKRNPIYKEIT